MKKRTAAPRLDSLRSMKAELKKKDRQVELLREALEFYGDPGTYYAIGFFADPPSGDFMTDFSSTTDFGRKPGKRARAALRRVLRLRLNTS